VEKYKIKENKKKSYHAGENGDYSKELIFPTKEVARTNVLTNSNYFIFVIFIVLIARWT